MKLYQNKTATCSPGEVYCCLFMSLLFDEAITLDSIPLIFSLIGYTQPRRSRSFSGIRHPAVLHSREHQANPVSCSMLGDHDFRSVPQRQPYKTDISVDAEGPSRSSSLGSIEMVAFEVRNRPSTPGASTKMPPASSQHMEAIGSVDTAPKSQKTTRKSSSFGSLSELEEDVPIPVRTGPMTSSFSPPPRHHSPFTSGNETQATQQNEDHHSSHSNALEEEERDEEYHHIWQDMRKELYQNNLVRLISRQRPGVLGYIDKMSGLLSGRTAGSLTSANIGYRIHFGDLQRIHIQYLHSKLVNLAVSAHLHDSEWRSGGKAEQIGQVMKEYSKSSVRLGTSSQHKPAARMWHF